MIVELWTQKREMGDEDENDVEDTSGYEESGVQTAWLGSEDLIWVILHCWSELVPVVSGMVYQLAHEILLSPNFGWSFPPFPVNFLCLVLNSTIP